MGITAHFIDHKYKMVDLTISIPHVQGMIFFNHFYHYIILILFVVQNYSCLEKLHTITADNASTNGKMAQELSTIIPHFNTNTHLLGCIAHVINLGPKSGLAVLGTINDNEGEEILMADLDPNSDPDPLNDNDAAKYHFSAAKWTQATLMQQLEPLCEVNNMLCESNYPTLNKALPIYIVLFKHLQRIEDYLLDTLKKPVYVCAMLLDPTFKSSFWKNNKIFSGDFYNLSTDNILESFCSTAKEFLE
ncbi:uncharacterized protein VP01_4596g2 [Puccinia sorghi]|uniref:hAT-like transposase RNase-H fold domain-containing protein n=1 Tax=Puccinia sorghi TaxID=27349 RepID=A0A0L6UPC3_9BASI|nr:uncharacterized protein VP01_4596g2 [Puccinia sorghi]